jgi:hypothetical protein
MGFQVRANYNHYINDHNTIWPAAAVIPAPIAYIKVVAVKKLVVEPWVWMTGPPHRVYWFVRTFPSRELYGLYWS